MRGHMSMTFNGIARQNIELVLLELHPLVSLIEFSLIERALQLGNK